VTFDAMLCDLAANSDRTTAWVTTAVGVTLVPAAATRRNRP
jgi:hypothetical protein